MKTLSIWASRYKSIAIGLIILGELFNGFNGVILGSSVLASLPLLWLHLGLLTVAGVVASIQMRSYTSAPYWVVHRWIFTALFCNFLSFSLVGGIWAHRINQPDSATSVLSSRRVTVVRDSIPRPEEIHQPYYSIQKGSTTSSSNNTLRRIRFILLGLLGVWVATYMAALACQLTCTHHAFWALLTFYAGLGGLAGFIYFISKATQRLPKRRREMSAEERKRDSKRFWYSWLILIGVASIFILLANRK